MPYVTRDRDGDSLWCGKTWVVDSKLCPWRTCFNPHDCGYTNSQGRWVRDGRCLTNYHRGCPQDERFVACCDEPEFSTRGRATKRTCRNCGRQVPVKVVEWLKEQENDA